MKNKLGMALVSLCTSLCLAGCGERGSVADPAPSLPLESKGMETEEEMVIDRSGFDWRESEWMKCTESKLWCAIIAALLFICHFWYLKTVFPVFRQLANKETYQL